MEIFAYGTLRDAEYQHALFGRTLAARPATLPGWLAVVAEGGFLTLVRAPDETVTGELLTLEAAALAIADAWEEVPLYERIAVEARAAGGVAVSAEVYVRPSRSRERAAPGVLSAHARGEVLGRIRAFRRDYERTSNESA